MLPVTAQTHISAPREEVYDFLVDLAVRPAWCGHFMRDFRLTTPRSSGRGAGARFRLDIPFGRRWAETTVVQAERPRMIREEGRTGRLGRTRTFTEYELASQAGVTRVALTFWTEPPSRLQEPFGMRGWFRRRTRRALARLRQIFEEPGREPLPRATIAGYEPMKAPRFGA